jgi:tRNA-specific 2-thiouridylase
VVDSEGTLLGRHQGVHRFTIGQRRGLGLGGGPARYVRSLDATTGTVTVADAAALQATGFVAGEVCWAADDVPAPETRLCVRVRHRHAPLPCRIVEAASGRAVVAFDGPGPAITPGQAAVFYDGEYVRGGGWIVGDAA